MRRLFVILAVLVMLLMVWAVSAQNGYPVGYSIVSTPPEANMHPLDYACNMAIYNAIGGTLVKMIVRADVDGYVVWAIPPRPADYYVTFSANGTQNWVIWNRETLDANCK